MRAVGLVGLVTLTILVIVRRRSDPALWAGAVYLLTWVVLGTAVLGFACGRGKRRMVWFGAALFGLGYMVLNRGPDRFEEVSYVHLVADQFLSRPPPMAASGRERVPRGDGGIATANTRITKTLDQVIPMRFPDPTPLEDVLQIHPSCDTFPGWRPWDRDLRRPDGTA